MSKVDRLIEFTSTDDELGEMKSVGGILDKLDAGANASLTGSRHAMESRVGTFARIATAIALGAKGLDAEAHRRSPNDLHRTNRGEGCGLVGVRESPR